MSVVQMRVAPRSSRVDPFGINPGQLGLDISGLVLFRRFDQLFDLEVQEPLLGQDFGAFFSLVPGGKFVLNLIQGFLQGALDQGFAGPRCRSDDYVKIGASNRFVRADLKTGPQRGATDSQGAHRRQQGIDIEESHNRFDWTPEGIGQGIDRELLLRTRTDRPLVVRNQFEASPAAHALISASPVRHPSVLRV